MCRFQIRGIGKIKSTTSVNRFGTATAIKNLIESIHSACCVLFQKPLIGAQEKIAESTYVHR